MGWIVAHLTIIPVMRMTCGSEHTGSDGRRYFGLTPAQQQRLRSATKVLGFLNEKRYGMFFRSGDVKAQTIEYTTGADAHRLAGEIVDSDILNKCRGGSSRLQFIGNP